VKKFIPEKTIFIIDGSSFLYRAYYAIRPMHTSTGQPIQGVFGFCRMLNTLFKEYKPPYAVLVWDSKGATLRHEIYEEYKATRQSAPSDLPAQKELIKEFAESIKLHQVERPGVEADDLMYSLAQDFHMHGFDSVLVTSDKDMGQAVTEDIFVFDPIKNAWYDQEALVQKYGFSVEKLVFYFALIGDASDNIPGVEGIGPKTATELVTQFDSLDDLYKNLDKVARPRTRELLQTGRESAFLSKQLFTLQYLNLRTKQDDFMYDFNQWGNARAFFEKLEFKSLLKDLKPAEDVVKTFELHIKYSMYTITTEDQLIGIIKEIKNHNICALDTETDGLHALQTKLAGISVAYKKGEAAYIPVGHTTGETQIPLETVIAYLKPILEDPSIPKYMHAANFDCLVLSQYGIEVKGLVFDTLLAASLVTKDWQRIGLKALSEHYLNEPMISFADVVKAHGYKIFPQVPLKMATDYAAADAHQTLALVPIMENELKSFEQESVFYDLEMPLVEVLMAMEKKGIIIDTVLLKQLSEQVEHELIKLRHMIIDLIGHEFKDINLNSSQQLAHILFEVLKLTPVKKTTAKTAYSTDSEVLETLAREHVVPRLIIKNRELFKLKSTYLDALGEYVNPKTGRIHTTFSQTAAATGRLASFDPNLQNIPLEGGIRAAFKAAPGHVFISADYSQIELGVLGYLSQDPSLIEAFQAGHDIHARTATGLFNVTLDRVTSEQRQLAKKINFSILYGLTPFGLSKDLNIPFSEAKLYIERYLAQFPGVVSWMEKIVSETKNKGYVTTWLGRRRYLPGIYEKNKNLYELARRMAINTAAQGTAAEIMKKGMIQLYKELEKHPGTHMLLQIHDELLFEVPENQVTEVENLVKETLESVVQWNIPLKVTTRIGKDWGEVTK
jgi:DNA polymerase-1